MMIGGKLSIRMNLFVYSVMLDFNQSFHCINHEILLDKLSVYGIQMQN